ncbi:MAG: hypothetical protein TREMPRED_005314 [Tremellales sp. Tagirdzhanova-0007]|nr:MAG: hypothetical protein TREMPRED_005314 [Tremellales sp. Tagirdzhanova-0007]
MSSPALASEPLLQPPAPVFEHIQPNPALWASTFAQRVGGASVPPSTPQKVLPATVRLHPSPLPAGSSQPGIPFERALSAVQPSPPPRTLSSTERTPLPDPVRSLRHSFTESFTSTRNGLSQTVAVFDSHWTNANQYMSEPFELLQDARRTSIKAERRAKDETSRADKLAHSLTVVQVRSGKLAQANAERNRRIDSLEKIIAAAEREQTARVKKHAKTMEVTQGLHDAAVRDRKVAVDEADRLRAELILAKSVVDSALANEKAAQTQEQEGRTAETSAVARAALYLAELEGYRNTAVRTD